ncbi:hypothetical protein N7281_02705 [Rickettsia hoogstraalii]|nr:hypothetical protein [Rickettsia hoogstraalii]MCX4083789.1 hypothetical protein [Rickettsia hoogstraalii]
MVKPRYDTERIFRSTQQGRDWKELGNLMK